MQLLPSLRMIFDYSPDAFLDPMQRKMADIWVTTTEARHQPPMLHHSTCGCVKSTRLKVQALS